MTIDLRAAALRQDRSIIARRWLASWIDLIVLAAGVSGAVFAQGHAHSELVRAIGWLFILCMVPAYYLVCEGLWHATPGKFICGIRVVAPPGGMNWWARITLRTSLRLIEVNPLLLGGVPAGIVALVTPTKQRLGDLCAGTFVLEVDEIREYGPDPWQRTEENLHATPND